MSERRAAVTAAEINDYLIREFDGLGNRCVDVGPDWAVARYDASEANLRPGGIISGPTLFALCDGVLEGGSWHCTQPSAGDCGISGKARRAGKAGCLGKRRNAADGPQSSARRGVLSAPAAALRPLDVTRHTFETAPG